jgi:hypothetical protein
LDVYLVEETPTGEILRTGEMIYCTPDDVIEGAYQHALVRAYTGLERPWKIAGAYAASFGDEIDRERLAVYYDNEENFAMLSLFDTYFMEEFADNSTLAIANDTAADFTAFLLAEYGPDAFFQPVGLTDYRQEWLNALGISAVYEPKYNLRFFEDAQYSSSEDYPLIITTDNRVYAFTGNFVDTPEPILQILSFYPAGMETVLDYIENNAPTYHSQIEPEWEETISYYFDGDLMGFYSDRSKRSFHVARPSVLNMFLETFSYFIPEVKGETQIWKNLGLGGYLYSVADVPDQNFFDYFEVLPDELSGDNAIYHSQVRDYYLAHAEYPASVNDLDIGLLFESMAIGTLSNPNLEFQYPQMSAMSIAETSREERKYQSYPGNDLTYPEAYLFTKYLVDTYGLEAMLTYCTTYSPLAFENIFGLSYADAFADFRAASIISR